MPLYTSTGTTTGSTEFISSDTAWRMWQSNATTSTASTDATWGRWNLVHTTGSSVTTVSSSATTSAVTTNDPIWLNWTTVSDTNTTNSVTFTNWVNVVDLRQETRAAEGERLAARQRISEEARARRAAEQERWRVQREEEDRKRKAAAEKAMVLLRSCLTDEQNRDLAAHGHFFVKAPSGNLYRIDTGRAGNVKRVDPQTKRMLETLCIHQRERVPPGDTMLMQKLLIETNEQHLRAWANITKRDGSYDRSRGGLLTGERLGQVLPFPGGEREAA